MIRLVYIDSYGVLDHWDCAPIDAPFILSILDDVKFLNIGWLK